MVKYWIFFIVVGLSQIVASKNDAASQQLPQFAEKHNQRPALVSDTGCPQDSAVTTRTVGKHGTLVLDYYYIQHIARLYTENTPERTLHAKGTGGFGYFEVTHDITKYTRAKLFEKVGEKTPIAIRFSGGVGEKGTADTTRDIQGYSIKFYTSEGNFDIVGANQPVFHIRDPSLIVHYSHALKRNPKTHVPDANARWDFFTSRPETCHAVMFRFSDRGIPDGYRHMDGFGIHAYKLVNDKKEVSYVKFTFKALSFNNFPQKIEWRASRKTDQGIKYLSSEQATYIAGKDPDYFIRDLYNAIEKKEYPSWTLYIQVMSAEDVEKSHYNPFDPTKVWPQKEYPLIPVGKVVLDQNPSNHFAEIEQLAFSPGSLVPGIEPSMDRLLQGRVLAYSEAQRSRLGTNFLQIPVNHPRKEIGIHNYNRDGGCVYFSQDGYPNYESERYNSPVPVLSAAYSEYNVNGTVKRYDLGEEDNFSQPRHFWNMLKLEEKLRLVENIADSAKHVDQALKEKIVKYFSEVSEEFGELVAKYLQPKA